MGAHQPDRRLCIYGATDLWVNRSISERSGRYRFLNKVFFPFCEATPDNTVNKSRIWYIIAYEDYPIIIVRISYAA